MKKKLETVTDWLLDRLFMMAMIPLFFIVLLAYGKHLRDEEEKK